MASTPAAAPRAGVRNFAALLAEFAAPEKKFPPARDLDGLAEDVATLSYEGALRAHARYRPIAGPLPMASPAPALPAVPLPVEPVEPGPAIQANAPYVAAKAVREKFRCASVTVRLSPAESSQLRQRAAEAGLTVSAYLRSCTFEVESLRAQVKATLAELRRAQATASERAAKRVTWWMRWRRGNKG